MVLHTFQKRSRVLARDCMNNVGGIGKTFIWLGSRTKSSRKLNALHVTRMCVFGVDLFRDFFFSNEKCSGNSFSSTDACHC
mmetsp:Transcript_86552/g.249927  ORF Transcript_86552/g.249927 Transcript_86552/m.249927 type:complete len:81 (+) Transcript_86552:882-1124(+)